MENVLFDIRLIFAILNGKVSAAISRKLYNNFVEENLNITPDQWTVLMHLDRKDGITQQELCDAVYKHKPSMTRLIDSMEEKELVTRVMDRSDRRKNTISLTAQGRAILEKSQKVALLTLKESLSGITAEELRISQNVLRAIFINTAEDNK